MSPESANQQEVESKEDHVVVWDQAADKQETITADDQLNLVFAQSQTTETQIMPETMATETKTGSKTEKNS